MPRPEPRVPRRRIACDCGFSVEGTADEVVDAARRHADTQHRIQLADGILRALARPVDDDTQREEATS